VKMDRATRTLLLTLVLGILISPLTANRPAHAADSRSASAQDASRPSASAQAKSPDVAPCQAEGKEITLSCDFAAMPADKTNGDTRIVLNHAAFSFKTKNENWMNVELTFSNAGAAKMVEAPKVYLAVDDAEGHNYIRRVLPHADFHSLAPGEHQTFSDRLLVPALRPGSYVIHLWIPDPNPSLQFNSAHNFLLSSVGVPDQKSGLNTVATFTVAR
jgi:Domain of unknown function (DUF4832)